MPLIKKKENEKKVPLRIKVRESVLNEMLEYMKWADIKYRDYFIEEACKLVLNIDKKWEKYKNETFEGNYKNKKETDVDLKNKMIAEDEGMNHLK
ncbi:hypothetical protein [Francisella sp. TX07-6608]|uniref:hypothetical protein n=1 Tax=Francisella sp. TX07-6608 TaxID=573568 RepID=UPI0008F99A49|nr:hypothetical protein [Francisella sp. TX07-6608]OIN82892.1 hypothetical protein KX00_2083 [Francisella sp. TX07-6608]OIN82980.1 hypothetical protein KX00_2065 [Francisella sp. TX07-6608]